MKSLLGLTFFFSAPEKKPVISYSFVSYSFLFSCGWSSSSSWCIYFVSPVRIAWPLVSVSLCFDFFFSQWNT